MPQPAHSTVRSTAWLRRLGKALRRAREGAGLTLEEAGRRLERTASSLSKIERGQVAVPVRDLRPILTVYGVPEQQHEGFVALAQNAKQSGWWDQYSAVLPPDYLDFLSFEAYARQALTFEPLLVPGLLQTPAYARAVIEAAPTDRQQPAVEDLLAVRAARQRALTRTERPPLHLTAVMSEGALRQQIGGVDVWRAQLQHLLQLSRCENIDLRVLPFSSPTTAAVGGPFVLLRLDDVAGVGLILVETPSKGLYMEEEGDVARYTTLIDELQDAALPADASVALITQLLELKDAQ